MNKPGRILLAVSVVINCVLLVFLLKREADLGERANEVKFLKSQLITSSERLASAVPKKTEASFAPSTMASFDWQNVESTDYKSYVENLRAIGCPEETIRDIVTQDLTRNFSARKWDLVKSCVSTNFWMRGFQVSITFDEEHLNTLREMEKQFDWSVKELVGVGADRQSLKMADSIDEEVAAKYGFLETSKIESIKNHLRDLHAELNYLPSAEREARAAEAQERILRELTPNELEEYELRSSPIARQMRESLSDVVLDEHQFRSAYRTLRGAAGNPAVPLPAEDIERAVLAAGGRVPF